MNTKTHAAVTLLFLATSGCQVERIPGAESGETSSGVPAAEYTLGSENTHNKWSSAIPPALTVPSGAIVEVHTKEASDGQITETSGPEDLAAVDFEPIHPLTGPVYVEGAAPGDVLAVTLHDIEVEGWGLQV